MLIIAAFAQLAAATAPMPAPEVSISYPYLEMCARAHDGSCRVEHITPLDVAYLNKLVAETITTVADGSPLDPWVAFPVDRRGDCDDHTATVRAALLALGVAPAAMRIELGEVTEPDGRRVGHAVLVVTLPNREGVPTEYVADRKTPGLLYPPSKRPYEWRPLVTQPADGLIWKGPD